MTKIITQYTGFLFILYGIYSLFITKDITNGLLSMILGELILASCRTYIISK